VKRNFIAEFVGTFALVFIGGGAIMMASHTGNPAGLLQIALAHGLILALMVSATMNVSAKRKAWRVARFPSARKHSASFTRWWQAASIIWPCCIGQ